MLAHCQEDALRRALPRLPARFRQLLAAFTCLFVLGIAPLSGRELDLVLLQRQEAARRRTIPAPKLHVHDANLHRLPAPGGRCGFTALTAPAGALHWPLHPRGRRSMELEDQIQEAEASIRNWENQLRTIEVDCAPYAIPDKEGYIAEKSAELERWIEGERYFIHLARKRLAGL